MRVVGLSMSGASLSGIHAQAARLAAIANSVPSGVSEEQVEDHRYEATSERQDLSSDMPELSDAEAAYNATAEAFDAGADIWDMLSVIQRD